MDECVSRLGYRHWRFLILRGGKTYVVEMNQGWMRVRGESDA
jgi:hypothetical protein